MIILIIIKVAVPHPPTPKVLKSASELHPPEILPNLIGCCDYVHIYNPSDTEQPDLQFCGHYLHFLSMRMKLSMHVSHLDVINCFTSNKHVDHLNIEMSLIAKLESI